MKQDGRDDATSLAVRLTTQSFQEAGGRDVYPHLELGSIVLVTTNNNQNTFETLLEKAFGKLSDKAQKAGYTHVFGIKFLPHASGYKHPSYGEDYKVVGTGYTPNRSNIEMEKTKR